jgi:hypothetical protein
MVKWILLSLFYILRVIALILLPFVLLIRGSVWLYHAYELNTWIALTGGVTLAFLALLIYFTFIYGSIFGFKKLSGKSMKGKAIVVAILVFVFCGYTLINLSGVNAKSGEVKKEFRSLHPFMRIGVGTLLLADRDALITDMSRTHGDYKKMGLKKLKNSLHYEQKDGYVHAMDLRTIGRGKIRNMLIKTYFQMMGFKTLRHVGTADHLHVSLPPHDKPFAL